MCYFVGINITTVLSYSDFCLYWCLAYMWECISALHIYVGVVPPYRWAQGVTFSKPSTSQQSSAVTLSTSLLLPYSPRSLSFLLELRLPQNLSSSALFSFIEASSKSTVHCSSSGYQFLSLDLIKWIFPFKLPDHISHTLILLLTLSSYLVLYTYLLIWTFWIFLAYTCTYHIHLGLGTHIFVWKGGVK